LPDGPSRTTVNVLENASKVEKEAAQGFAAVAAEVTMRQVHRRMPQAHGLFDEEDAHDHEYATDDEEELASDPDENEEDEDDEEEKDDKGKSTKRKRDDLSEQELNDEDEDEDEDDRVQANDEDSESEDVDIDDENNAVDEETLRKFASDDEDKVEAKDDSDSDSDGYGPGGLSFDQVLAEIKGDIKEKPSGVGKTVKKREKMRGETYGVAKSTGKTHKGTVSFVAKAKESDGKRDRSRGARRPTQEKRSKMVDI